MRLKESNKNSNRELIDGYEQIIYKISHRDVTITKRNDEFFIIEIIQERVKITFICETQSVKYSQILYSK